MCQYQITTQWQDNYYTHSVEIWNPAINWIKFNSLSFVVFLYTTLYKKEAKG